MARSTTWDERWAEFSLLAPIIGSHIRRIGLVRTAAGGLPMYLAIPFLVMIAVGGCLVGYQWLLRPILGLPRVRWRDHVVVDRHRIDALSWFDKFNCMLCAVANGLCTMVNMELDHLAAAHVRSPLRRGAAGLLAVAVLPLGLAFELLGVRIVYDVLVSRPLGMHRTTSREALDALRAGGFASGWGSFGRAMIRFHKQTFLRFSLALEQIESSWCPLRHFETREGIVYPEHHARFFGPAEIDAMRELLSTVGTVSPRRPTW